MSARIFHAYIDETEQGTYAVSSEREGPRTKVTFAPHDPELEKLVVALHSRDGMRSFNDPFKQDEASETIGTNLFNSFFVGGLLVDYRAYRQELQTAEDDNRLPRIGVHLPRSLQYLPWEVLKDPADEPGQFLSIRGSVIRYDRVTEPRSQPIGVDTVLEDPAEFVVVISNPTKDPVLNLAIDKSYRSAKFIHVTPAEFEGLRRELGKERLGLIFFGHGKVFNREGYLYFVKKKRSGMFATFEEDRRPANAIGKELAAAHTPRLVCVLACESALVEKAVDFERTVAGTLVTTTRAGAVIGAQEMIDQTALMRLLDSCISSLVIGTPLDLSLRTARLDIMSIPEDEPGAPFARLDWWIPTLYARTQNFDIIRPPGRARRKRVPKVDRSALIHAAPIGTGAVVPTLRQLAAHAWDAVRVADETLPLRG